MRRNLLIIFIMIMNLFVALYHMYASNDQGRILVASYLYLSLSFLLALIIFTKARIQKREFYFNLIVAIFYYIVSLLLTLVCMYSSPSNTLEAIPSVLFFLSGNVVFSAVLMLNIKHDAKFKEMGIVGKIIRFLLYAFIFSYPVQVVVSIVMSGKKLF